MSSFKGPETPHEDCSGGREVSAESALTIPVRIDPDWIERIALAKQAYRDGKKLREGKPILFRTSRTLGLGDGRYG